MTTQNQTKSSYEAVLADLRAQRAKIDNTIGVLEAMSGLGLADTQHLHESGDIAIPQNLIVSDALDEGAFHGMSIADATKKLLAFRKRKMGNPEIARALAAGGLVMHSADPVNTVGAVLTRRFNNVGDIVKVARGTWGLKEWYPGRNFKTTKQSAHDVIERAVTEMLYEKPDTTANSASRIIQEYAEIDDEQ